LVARVPGVNIVVKNGRGFLKSLLGSPLLRNFGSGLGRICWFEGQLLENPILKGFQGRREPFQRGFWPTGGICLGEGRNPF